MIFQKNSKITQDIDTGAAPQAIKQSDQVAIFEPINKQNQDNDNKDNPQPQLSPSPNSQPQLSQQLQYCEINYEDGSKYIGQMLNGNKQGEGIFFYLSGGFYEGTWKNNMMHGFGRLYFENSMLAYEGQFQKDQFHGKGKVYNDSAEMFEKEFEDENQITQNLFQDDEQAQCQYKKPQPNPNAYFDYTDFNKDAQKYWVTYQGDIKNDIKQGIGKVVFSNGEYYYGQFKEDKVHGQGKFYSKKNGGQLIKGIWKQGVLQKTIQVLKDWKAAGINPQSIQSQFNQNLA